MTYNADDLVIHNWAEARQLPNQKWERLWEIVLVAPIPTTLDLMALWQMLSYEGFQVSITVTQDQEIAARVITDEWSWTDHLYFATYRLFEEIDTALGTIDRIQGQQRNEWYPWLARENHADSNFAVSRLAMKEVEVGLRIDPDRGMEFYGIEDVNQLLSQGAKVVELEPGGALTRMTAEGSQEKRMISGFCLKVKLEVSNLTT